MHVSSDILVGLAAQAPLSTYNDARQQLPTFDDKPTVNVTRAFTPKDLVEQPNVGTAVLNPSGTLLFVPYSQWSLDTDT